MTEWIEFDPVDRITAGAVGPVGQRRFLIQAERGEAVLSVLVEKEQVAVLSARLLQLLETLDEQVPDEGPVADAGTVPSVDDQPEAFRCRMMRLGFDSGRDLVVLELFEETPAGLEELEEDADPHEIDEELEEGALGQVARLYATRSQMRMVALRGAEAVASGRPLCRLCMLPMDPDGHDCPSKN